MTEELFKEGGPHQATKTGKDQYNFTIKIPGDESDCYARECPSDECSPGYFKVLGGTGITGDQQLTYCPYCRHEDDPSNFVTKEQVRYAKDIVMQEASDGIQNMINEALGLGSSGKRKMGGGLFSIEMSMKKASKQSVRRPFDEELRRDVICPHCGLDQTVYGLATWCYDCGSDIFLTHATAELSVIWVMVGDIPRRREHFGARVASKDLENSLEDVVSIFEAVMRALAKRRLLQNGQTLEQAGALFKKLGNAFQNLSRTDGIFKDHFNHDAFAVLTKDEYTHLEATFAKRHLITHNLGIVDRKYIDQALSAEREGREVLVIESDITQAIDLSMRVFAGVHSALFSSTVDRSDD